VVLTEEDFQKAQKESTDIIDILKVVDADQINPIYYTEAYYLAPDPGPRPSPSSTGPWPKPGRPQWPAQSCAIGNISITSALITAPLSSLPCTIPTIIAANLGINPNYQLCRLCLLLAEFNVTASMWVPLVKPFLFFR
jgi:hypothetical protein